MRVHIKKRGNSASVRIPTAIMSSASLRIDQEVDVREEGGCIIIAPVKNTFDLNDLLEQMNPNTFHEEIDFGTPNGNET